jgi:hypothetical protein
VAIRAAFISAFVLLLAACADAPGPARPVAAPADAVATNVEQGGKFISLVGPMTQHSEPFLGVPGTNFDNLRSLIDTRTGETVHQLYVEDSYAGAKREWNAAHDAKGQSLRFIPIKISEISCDNGCAYAEEFAAAIPDAELRANPQSLTVFFNAKAGNQMAIPISGALIAKQLAAVDAARAKLPSAAAETNPARPTAR